MHLDKLWYVNLHKGQLGICELLVWGICVADQHSYNIGTNALWKKTRYVVTRIPYNANPISIVGYPRRDLDSESCETQRLQS